MGFLAAPPASPAFLNYLGLIRILAAGFRVTLLSMLLTPGSGKNQTSWFGNLHICTQMCVSAPNIQKTPSNTDPNLFFVVRPKGSQFCLFGQHMGCLLLVFFKKGVLLLSVSQEKPWSLLGSPFPVKKSSSEVLKGRMRQCAEDEKEESAELVGIMCCMGQ